MSSPMRSERSTDVIYPKGSFSHGKESKQSGVDKQPSRQAVAVCQAFGGAAEATHNSCCRSHRRRIWIIELWRSQESQVASCWRMFVE